MNSQFFFNSISIFQIFGHQYTQFDLINPKIITFDPDEMDYGVYDAATISISFAYEAIIYQNNGQPAPISQNSALSAAFNGVFNGDALPVPGAPANLDYLTSSPNINRCRYLIP